MSAPGMMPSRTIFHSSPRSTTMVVPIAVLGAAFLLLIIFPVIYRTIGAG